jgi:DNA-binding NarL/FixJ family response regulator
MDKKIKIIIVDDNKQFVEGVKLLLSKQNDYEIIGTANSGDELFQLKTFGYADIILLDIEMPEMNGFEIAKKINWTYPKINLIAITMYQEKVYLDKLVKVGFKGFVNKTELVNNVISVINSVAKGKLVFPDDINLLN